MDLAAERHAVQRRQLAIEQHRIKALAVQQIQRGAATVGGAHPITELEQHAAHDQLIDAAVIGQ
ncbi:hypothetical protein D3C84_1147920 [compost metagenome]